MMQQRAREISRVNGGSFGKLAAARLLGSTALLVLSATPAFADGGASANAVATGVDSATGRGGDGGSTGQADSGGGGGAGTTGGDGGNGRGVDGGIPGTGGVGGTTPGAAGGAGTAAQITSSGGGGGGGGAHGAFGMALPGAPRTGGNGGRGGDGLVPFGTGGGGGAGGFGFVVTGSGALGTLSSNVTGGNGGAGGNALTTGGNGGSGGIGILFNNAAGSTVTITGAVTGGNGGARGTTGAFPGTNGVGGIGLSAANLGLTLNGKITGGLSGDGMTRADAIRFTSGTNSLTLGTGFGITGGINIVTGELAITPEAGGSTLSNIISGGGALTKAGAGTLTLSGANTYTGITTVSAGTLAIENTSALGSSAAGTVVQNGATLRTAIPGGSSLNEAITINGTGFNNGGALQRGGGAGFAGLYNLAGLITLGSNASINNPGGVWEFVGGISAADFDLTVFGNGLTDFTSQISLGSGRLINNSGILSLRDTNAAIGGLVVNGGSVTLGSTISIPDRVIANSAAVTMTGGRLLVARSETVGSLAGTGGLVDDANQGTTLSVGGNNASTVFAGTIGLSIALAKQGTGTLTLSGANTYSGSTAITGGTLAGGAANAFSAASAHTLSAGATLDLGGFNQTIGSLAGRGGTVTNSGADAATLTVGGDNTSTTFAGLIENGNGTLGLAKTGSGTLTLTGTNSYSGGTTIAGGTIVAGNGSALGSAQVTLAGGALVLGFDGTLANNVNFAGGTSSTLAAASGATVELTGGLFAGAKSTVRFGSAADDGTLVLSNLTTGATSPVNFAVDGGILRIGSGGLFADLLSNVTPNGSTISIASGATLDLNGATTFLGNLSGAGIIANSGGAIRLDLTSVQGFGGTFDTGLNGITLTGSLTGLAGFTKTGAGTLTLASGLDTSGFTGGLTLAEGTLSLQTNLGAGFGTITTTGSVITYGDGITSAAPIAINSDTTQLQVLTGSATQSGVISQVGGTARGFEKIGAGTLTLSGANTYVGVTTISQGALGVANNAALGTADGNTIVADGASLLIGGRDTFEERFIIAEAITISGEGLGGQGAIRRTVGGLFASDILGPITLASDSLIVVDDFLRVQDIVALDHDLTIGGSGFGRLSVRGGVNIGSGNLIIDGPSRVDLLGASTFTGNLTISAESVQIGLAGTAPNTIIGDLAHVELNRGYLGFANQETIGSLSGDAGTEVGDFGFGGVTLTVGGNNASTLFEGEFIQGLALNKTGTGTLTLTGDSTHSGGTTISAGTIAVGSNTALGTGAVVFAGGSLRGIADVTIDNFVLHSAPEATISAAAGTTLTLRGSRTGFNGGLTRYGTASDTGVVVAAFGSVASPSVNTFVNESISIDGGTLRIGNALSATHVSNVGVFLAGGINVDGTLDLNGFEIAVNQLTGSGTITNNGGAATLTTRNPVAATTFAGTIADGKGALGLIHDRGTLTLTGTNSHSGGTTLASGTLVVAGDAQLGTGQVALGGGNLRVTQSGTIDNNISALQGSTGTLSAATGTEVTLTGLLRIEGVSGPSTLTLGSAGDAGTFLLRPNSFGTSGARANFTFAVGGGTVRLANGNNAAVALPAGTNITRVASGALLDLGGQRVTITQLHGAGSVINDGSRTEVRGAQFSGDLGGSQSVAFVEIGFNNPFSVTGQNSFTGALEASAVLALTGNGSVATDTINILSRELQTDGGAFLGNPAITVSAPGTLAISGDETIGSLAGSGTVTLTGARLTTGANNQSTTFSGSIGGTGSLTKTGSGTLTLSGTSTYAGGTNVDAGTLALGANNALPDLGTILLAGTLDLATFTDTVASVNLTSGTIAGSGGALDVTGDYVQSGGTLAAGAMVNVGTGGVIRLSGGTIAGTLNGLRTGDGAGIVNGGSAVVTGTLDLAGGLVIGNSGTGALTISAGGHVDNASAAIGVFANATGTVTVTGTGSQWENTGSIRVGDSGKGTLEVLDGAVVTSSEGIIGFFASISGNQLVRGNGTVLVSGAGSRWEAVNEIVVGGSGVADLTISNGGVVSNTAGIIGFNGVSSGTAMVTGPGSRWENSDELTIGRAGIGTLTISSGGTVTADNGTFIARSSFGPSTVIFGAAEGNAAVAAGTLETPSISFGIGTGTIVFNHTSADFELAAAMSGNGTLKQIAGTTTLSGDSSGFTGSATVSGGALIVNGSLGGMLSLTGGGMLGGTGTLGTVIVGKGGQLAPGQSPGTLTAENLELNEGSLTTFELGEAGVVGGANNDLIRVTGTLAFNGGAIAVEREAGFGSGIYTLFEFADFDGRIGNMTLNPLGGGFRGTLAIADLAAGSPLAAGGSVVLNVAAAADFVHWNGTTTTPTGAIVGGSGTWDLESANFANAAGTVSGPWAGNGALAVFGGPTGGLVTIADDTVLSPSGLIFTTDGYVINAGNAASGLTFAGPTGIDTAGGVGAAIAAPIAGAGSITKTGTGTLTLLGANTYEGATTVLAGTLVAGSNGALGSGSDPVVVASGATLSVGSGVTNGKGVTINGLGIGNAGALRVGSGAVQQGTVTLASASRIAGDLGSVTDIAADFDLSLAGRLTVEGGISGTGSVTVESLSDVILAGANNYAGTTTISANASLALVDALSGPGGGTFGAGAVINNGSLQVNRRDDVTIANAISGSGVLFKTGSGTTTLTGANSYDGTTTVISGMLVAANSTALGSAAGGTIVQGRAALGLEGGIAITGEALTLNGAGLGGLGNLRNLSGTNSFTGTTTLAGSSLIASDTGSLTLGAVALGSHTLTVAGAGSTRVDGAIGGTGSLVKQGSGGLTLAGTNSYTGTTTILGGDLTAASSSALGTGGAGVVVANGASLTLLNGVAIGNKPLTLSGNGLGGGALRAIGAASYAGPITVAANSRILGVGGSLLQIGGTIETDFALSFGGNIILVGAVEGTGSITADSGAFVGMAAANTYAGTTTINAGAIIALGSGPGGGGTFGAGAVVNNGAIRLQRTDGYTLDNAISGTGAVGKFDIGTVSVTGANSYAGTTDILAGTLIALSDTALGSAAGGTTVATGATLALQGGVAITGEALTLSGAGFGGLGALRNLSGDNGFAGTITLAAESFVTSDAGRLTLGAIELGTHTLVVDGVGDVRVDGVIAGSGGLFKQGLGTLTLAGDNTFTGLVEVAEGTLANSGTLAGALINDAIFANTGTVAGLVTNNGALDSSGTLDGGLANGAGAVATLSGSGAVNGNVLNDGTITVVRSVSGIGRLTQGSAGVFALGSGDVVIGSLAGAGIVRLGASGLTVGLDNSDSRFDGVIEGTGRLAKTGTGTLTLGGASTFTGLASAQGGTLALDAAGSLAGGVQVEAARFVNAGSVAGGVTNGGTVISTGALGGGLTNLAGAAAQVANILTGPVSNAGTITLTGATTGIGALTQQAGGTFDLGGNDTTIGSLAGAGTVLLGAGTLTLGGNNADASFAGTIAGSGGLVKTGTGTFTLAGANTFTGPATVAAGTLAIAANGSLAGGAVNAANLVNAGTIAGAVVNTGTLVSTGTLGGGLVNSGTARIAGTLSGALANSGTVTLTAPVTGIGAVTQEAGGSIDLAGFSAAFGSLAGNGSVTLGTGALGVGGNGTSTTFGGVISGTGSLVKTGAGTFTLTGTNTYTGGTTIAAGTLRLGEGGTGGSIVGPVVNNGALVISRSNAFTFAGAISGTGALVQDGPGTTTLTGANSYTGGTLIRRGGLVGDTGSLQGAILVEAGGLLTFAQAANGTYAGALSGAGRFDKTGAGLLTLTGTSDGLTGGTFVEAGELRVEGSLANSVVTVRSGARLSGSGVIGGLIASSGSFVAPGSSPGTLTVDGNVALQAGSTSEWEISATGATDRILATGTATLGGTASFINLGGNYDFNTEIALVEAAGGVSGTFALATGLDSFGIRFRPELVYTASGVRLRLAPNLLGDILATGGIVPDQFPAPPGGRTLTANQQAVISRLDGALLAGFDLQSLFALYNLPTSSIPDALDQFSGEVYATAAGVGIEQERVLREAVLGRISEVAMAARAAPEAGIGAGAWGQLFGGWGDGESDGNAAAFDTDRGGIIAGLDFGSASDEGAWRIGVFGMHITSDVRIGALQSNAEVRQSGGGAYASLSTGGLTAAVGGYFTTVDLTGSRNIAVPGFTASPSGVTEGDARQAFAELSYSFALGKGTLRPFVAGAVGGFDLDALTERGGVAALAVGEQDYTTGSVTGGIDALLPMGGGFTLAGTLAARAQLGDRDPQAQIALAGAPQQAFAVRGAQLDEVALAARLEALVDIAEGVDLGIGYSGLIGSTIQDHGARATLSVRF